MDRSHRKASLTDSGKVFYLEALILIRQYERMLDRMASCRTASNQVIRIGALPVLAQYGLTARLKSFRELHDDAQIILEEAEEQELLEGIKYGKYDLIIAREDLVRDHDFKTYLLAEDELVAVLPSRHPAAHTSNLHTALSLKQIEEEPFILMHKYTSVYHLCLEEFARLGIQPDIVRTARVETIISTVAEGEAVSLIPKSNLELFRHSGITSLPLDPPVSLNLVLAKNRKKKENAFQKEFVRFMTAECKRPILMRSDTKLPQPFAGWSNSL